MRLSLAAIDIEAFKNFAARTVLDISALAPGLHFVRGINGTNDRLGSNGAGKSTLLADAPTWCLTGRTAGGLRTTDVRSWLAKGAPRVALTLRGEDGDHVVQRGPRATDLTIDGRAVGQDEVDALVGIGPAALSQAVIWGQGQPLFYDLEPARKMALLSDALGLERWERRAEAAAARGRRLAASLTALEGELRGLEAAEEHAAQALAQAREAASRWGTEQAERLRELGAALDEARRKHADSEVRRAETDLAGESAGVQARMLRPAVVELTGELRALEAAAEKGRAMRARAARDLAEVRRQISSLADAGTCPMCGQAVRPRDAGKHLRELRARAAELEAEVGGEEDAGEDERLRELRERLRVSRAALTKFEAEEGRQDAERHLLEREESAAAARVLAAETALRSAEAEVNPHREASTQARARLRDVKRQLAEEEERARKLEASAERAQFWARGFRDIRLAIIDDVLDDLRETTAAVVEDLGLGGWEIAYATERETKSGTVQRALHVTIRSPGAGGEVRWEAYSGGERQRLRLAGALALSEVLLSHAGVAIDFRVLDEPTRGLSREGVRDLVEVLGEYARDAGLRIFFVDHMASEGMAFASAVTVWSGAGGAQATLQETT